MHGQRELVDTSPLPPKVEDPDLWVWDSTVEPALGIGLVLAVTIALCWSPTHDSEIEKTVLVETVSSTRESKASDKS